MSVNEQKESPSPPPPPQQNAPDEFVDALNKDGDEGLQKAFHVLSKGAPKTLVKDVDLHRAVTVRGSELSLSKAKEIIRQVNKEGSLSCEEFVRLLK